MIVSEQIKLDIRETGKGNSRDLRKKHKIPGVIYGPKMKNQNVIMDELFVVKHSGSKHESSIFETKSDHSTLNSLKVMLRKIQSHPTTGRPVHVDLYAPDMETSIRVNVTIKFVGEPIGVRKDGGIRQITMGQIEVKCNPNEIPAEIQVDISHLKTGQSMHVSEMTFPPSAKPLTAPDRTIVTVNHPKKEKVVEVDEGVAGEGDQTDGKVSETNEGKKADTKKADTKK